MSNSHASYTRGDEAVRQFTAQLAAFVDHWIPQLPVGHPVRRRCAGLLLELVDVPPADDPPAPEGAPLKLFPMVAGGAVRQMSHSTPEDSAADLPPVVRPVLEMIAGLRTAGYQLMAPGGESAEAGESIARAMDCPGCDRHGMEHRAVRHAAGMQRDIAYCKHCKASLEINADDKSEDR